MNIRILAAAAIGAVGVAAVAIAEPPGDLGAFHADCFYSHSAPVDPIVFPGQAGASHMHDFIGSQITNESSTNNTIRNGPNNCARTDSPDRDADKSAYWVPALYVNDVAVRPAGAVGAYYTTNRRRPGTIRPFPTNFRAIAGIATGGPQVVNSQAVYSYDCPGGVQTPASSAATAPTCQTNRLDVSIRFPDCWDGAREDSANHRDHVAYSRLPPGHGVTLRECPSSHPVAIPAVRLVLRYPTTGGPSTRLASGDLTTSHADLMNGWDVARFEQLIRDCLNQDKYCGGGDGPAHSAPGSGTPGGTTSPGRTRSGARSPSANPFDGRRAATHVTLRVSDGTPGRRARVRFFGSVRPARDGRFVQLQRRNRRGSYVTVARIRLKDAGSRRSKFSKRRRVSGDAVFRARLRADNRHRSGTSRARRLNVF
jgi:hypothetical protein